MMQVDIILPEELGPDEIAAWHRMQKATPALTDPFLSPEYATAVGQVRPQSRVAVLTDGQATVGFFPFEKRRLGVGVPVSGWLSACQGVVHEPDMRWNMSELLRGCGLSAWHFDNLVADQAASWSRQAVLEPAPVIDLPGCGYGAYYAKLRERETRFCRELERKTRKLARDAGDLRLELDSADASLLRLLMRWKSAQYRETRHVDRFAHSWVSDLMHTILAERQCNLLGMLSVLFAGEQPVSIQYGLRTGGVLSGWFTGYSRGFAQYSPGLIHLRMMVESLGEAGVDSLHMGKGAKQPARAFKTRDIEVGAGTITTSSALGITHRTIGGISRGAVSAARRYPAVHHMADRVLRSSGMSSRFYGKV